MTGTNAIHGIVAARRPAGDRPRRQRRLQQGDPRDRDRVRHDQHRRRLPRHRPHARDVQAQAEAEPTDGEDEPPSRSDDAAMRQLPADANFLHVLYIVAFALFIYGLLGLTGPRTAVRGNRIAAVGMAIAVIATLLKPGRGQLGADRARRRDRHRRRRPRGAQGEDDRDAADGRAVQRRRRRRRLPDRVGGVPPHRRLPRHRHLHRGLLAVRGDRRLDLLLGLEHRLRQAPGAPPRAADHARARASSSSTGCCSLLALAAGDRDRRRRPLRSCSSSGCCSCAALLGNAVVLPIGGADMPVVISLLNAFTGLSAAATGVALEQPGADRRGDDRRAPPARSSRT